MTGGCSLSLPRPWTIHLPRSGRGRTPRTWYAGSPAQCERYEMRCATGAGDAIPLWSYGPLTSFWTVAPDCAAAPVSLMTWEIVPRPPPSDTITMFRSRTRGATGTSKA